MKVFFRDTEVQCNALRLREVFAYIIFTVFRMFAVHSKLAVNSLCEANLKTYPSVFKH